MGDMADDVEYLSCVYEGVVEEWEEKYYALQEEKSRRKERPKELPSNKIWTTGDGTPIKIGSMTDKHLNNAIKYMKNKLNDLV